MAWMAILVDGMRHRLSEYAPWRLVRINKYRGYPLPQEQQQPSPFFDMSKQLPKYDR